MNLLKLNLFRGSIFKQAKFLASSPQRVETVVYISEPGTISRETLPMNTAGTISSEKENMTWAVLHSLKMKMKNFGQPIQDARVLLICERSYMPLDPQNKIRQKEKDKIASLQDIARNRHAVERANVGVENAAGETPLTEGVTYGSLIIIGLCVLTTLLGC